MHSLPGDAETLSARPNPVSSSASMTNSPTSFREGSRVPGEPVGLSHRDWPGEPPGQRLLGAEGTRGGRVEAQTRPGRPAARLRTARAPTSRPRSLDNPLCDAGPAAAPTRPPEGARDWKVRSTAASAVPGRLCRAALALPAGGGVLVTLMAPFVRSRFGLSPNV